MPPPTQQLKDVATTPAFKPPAGANAAVRQAVPQAVQQAVPQAVPQAAPQAVPQVVPACPTTAVEQPRPVVARNAPPLQDIKPANPKAVISGAPQGGEQDEVVAKHSTRRTSTFRSTFRDATEGATPEWDAEISPPLPGSEERRRRRGVRRPAELPLLHLPKVSG